VPLSGGGLTPGGALFLSENEAGLSADPCFSAMIGPAFGAAFALPSRQAYAIF
jgi:hypothetical protein